MKAIEQIARLVCAGDNHDPDARVMQYAPAIGAFGRPVMHGEVYPQWELYDPMVRAVITTLLEQGAKEDDFRAFAEGVLTGQVEAPPPEPEEIERQNWRVFYGLKR